MENTTAHAMSSLGSSVPCKGVWHARGSYIRTNPNLAVLPKRTFLQRINRRIDRSNAGLDAATAAEEEANAKRWEESGGGEGSVDAWRWRLEWDALPNNLNIIVGSCPRSPSDMERIAAESGATAILSLQSDVCLEALVIDYPLIRQRALELGVLAVRVPILDFSLTDQTAMLPEAVRMLSTLLAMGKMVYIHCTAGINRATLTSVGYLTFVLGMQLDEAVQLVKAARPQAHPYLDCWSATRARMLEGRREEVKGLARSLFVRRQESGAAGDRATDMADWVAAENLLIKETFRRHLAHNISLITALHDIHAVQQSHCFPRDEAEALAIHVDELQRRGEQAQAALASRSEELAVANEQLAALRTCSMDSDDAYCGMQAVAESQEEIASLRGALRAVAANTRQMVQDVDTAAA